jgi:hypothetical protein
MERASLSRTWLAGVLAAALSTSCADSQEDSNDSTEGPRESTGAEEVCEVFEEEPDASTGDSPNPGGECSEVETLVGYSDPTPLGISAEEALAGMLGTRSLEIVIDDDDWLADWVVPVYPGTLTVSYEGGEVRYVERTDLVDDPEDWCDDWLSVDVVFTFEADDGSFSLTVPAPLRSDGMMMRELFPASDVVTNFDFANMFDDSVVCETSLHSDFYADPELVRGFMGASVVTPDGAGGHIIATWCSPADSVLCF